MELREIYETYIRKVTKVMANASTFDGLWGWGDDPKKDACHMEFYEAVENYLQGLIQNHASEEALFTAADWIIRAAADHKGTAAYWYMFAAHGLCKDLIPLLTPAHCAGLRDFYDEHYPRFDRLPVQRDLYKLLKKRAKA
jgi:hypothetical protein